MRPTTYILFAFCLLLFGLIRLPFEFELEKDQQSVRLRQTKLDIELREQVGQLGFLAALSGFRSPLAAILWIEAHNAWENLEWGRMAGLLETVLTLQPRSLIYWDMASWQMAWNASIAALNDKSVQSEALRQHYSRNYIVLGRQILERGIKNNPESALLHERLGILLRDKLEDYCAAAEAFRKASELPGSLPYVKRFVGYMLAKCPGREREAYEWLRKLYDEGSHHHLPTLLVTLRELEQKLEIPHNLHIPPQPPHDE